MTINYIKSTLLVLSLLALFNACQTTKLVGSWKKPEATPKKFTSLGVVAMIPNMSNRTLVETSVAGELRSKGIAATATFDIFPLAGKKDIVKELDIDPEELKKMVKARIQKFEFDAILIVGVLDVQKESRYNQGASFSFAFPVYDYTYYGYYNYAYSTIHYPGYYTTNTTYFVESNLYDVNTENLIWTGQTKTEDPQSVAKEAPDFAKLIVNEMISKNALSR